MAVFFKTCKWILILSVWFVHGKYQTAGAATGSTSIDSLSHWQHLRDIPEALLRFPFAEYLANPCGITIASPQRNIPIRPIRRPDDLGRRFIQILHSYESIEVQSHRFVASFINRYSHLGNLTDEQSYLIDEEFQRLYTEIRILMKQLYMKMVFPNCLGIHLDSLGSPAPIFGISGKIRTVALYRNLMIATSHFHLMADDMIHSRRRCRLESNEQAKLIQILTGKLETMMCLVLQSASSITEHLFAVVAKVLASTVHRYNECSSRQVRSCLTMNFTDSILNSINQFSTITRRFE